MREAFCLSPLLSPAAKRAGVKPQGWGRLVCLGRHNLALQALSKWLSAVLAPPHALVMLTQGGFWDKPLPSRKLWASLVPMGKCGPWGHPSSCRPAETSAFPLGQDLTFALDDGLNVNIAISWKLQEELSQRC